MYQKGFQPGLSRDRLGGFQQLFLPVLEAGSPSSGNQDSRFLERAALQLCRQMVFPLCSPHGERWVEKEPQASPMPGSTVGKMPSACMGRGIYPERAAFSRSAADDQFLVSLIRKAVRTLILTWSPFSSGSLKCQEHFYPHKLPKSAG